jgi:hypothetical protein
LLSRRESTLVSRPVRAENEGGGVDAMDDSILEQLTEHLRRKPGGAEGEKMVWAFEQALKVAAIDEELLDYVLAATVCLVAVGEESTPRSVLDTLWRRAVSDTRWREEYLPLFS